MTLDHRYSFIADYKFRNKFYIPENGDVFGVKVEQIPILRGFRE